MHYLAHVIRYKSFWSQSVKLSPETAFFLTIFNMISKANFIIGIALYVEPNELPQDNYNSNCNT